MCPPDHYRIEGADNHHMVGQTVDPQRARSQWLDLVQAYQSIDVDIIIAHPRPDLPDMVFTANPVLCGPPGSRIVVPARMRHPGRAAETDHLVAALPGHEVRNAKTDAVFEGSGDFLWTPSGDLIAASGPRTDAEAIPAVAACFGVTPAVTLRLREDRFYHLDTCLCILDDTTAMWVPDAFDQEGRDALRERFRLLDVSVEAMGFAANAHCPDGHNVVIDAACTSTIQMLQREGYTPIPVDTSEFRKSGGSVFCLKQTLS